MGVFGVKPHDPGQPTAKRFLRIPLQWDSLGSVPFQPNWFGIQYSLGGGFKYLLFSPHPYLVKIPILTTVFFPDGLKPPTSSVPAL